jgi:hypothetical protein
MASPLSQVAQNVPTSTYGHNRLLGRREHRREMQRSSTTVVCLVGATAAVTNSLAQAANVELVVPDADDSPLDRAVAAARAAARAPIPYVVHDADPLSEVGEAWGRYFEEQAPVGELEVAVKAVVDRWRAGSLDLPDYYLVLDLESLPPNRRHWFGGVLHADAPVRVVPVEARPVPVMDALGHLAPGRRWSPLDELLAGLERRLPDRAGLPRAPDPSRHPGCSSRGGVESEQGSSTRRDVRGATAVLPDRSQTRPAGRRMACWRRPSLTPRPLAGYWTLVAAGSGRPIACSRLTSK